MKHKVVSAISLFVAVMMFVGLFPMNAYAADNEKVLTSIDHPAAIEAANVSGKDTATLTVPSSYADTVDLAEGLDLRYDKTVYSSVIASFPSGSEAEVGGDPVVMTVTYRERHDRTEYATNYKIYVAREKGSAPTFSGTIKKTVTLPDTLTFKAVDFTDLYVKNDGEALGYIVITGHNPSFGALMLDDDPYDFGDKISLSDLNDGDLTFKADKDGSVSYTVKAYSAGDDGVQAGSATLKITVLKEAEEGIGTIAYDTEVNKPVAFDSDDFEKVFKDETGSTLSYVTFKLPSEDDGTLYYNYRSESDPGSEVTESIKYFNVSHITFVPEKDSAGIVTIEYKAYNEEDESISGEIKVTVKAENNDDGSWYFGDVRKDHKWAAEAIDYLYEHGIITGTKHGYYNPNARISRGDFILMLCRAFDLKADVSGNFSDVEEGSYYFHAIGVAKKLGIGKGDKKGRFNPKGALSRQDAMVLLVRALEASGETLKAGSEDDLKAFSDSRKISDYAVDAVAKLVKAGYVSGDGDKLNPQSSISRAEIAVILYRILTSEE